MSLLLDTGNFKMLQIDGKVVSKLFFNGDKIYDTSKWFAYGNLFSSTSILSTWGNNNRKLVEASNQTSVFGYCIGNIRQSSNTKVNSGGYSTNEDLSEFALLGTCSAMQYMRGLLNIDSFLECKNIYYVSMFKQTTYDGDLLIKPFIFCGSMSGKYASSSKVMGYSNGIGNDTSDITDNGFCYLYPSSAKGKTVKKISKFNETHMNTLDRLISGSAIVPYFLCKAFKTDESTTNTTATASYGGCFLFEM